MVSPAFGGIVGIVVLVVGGVIWWVIHNQGENQRIARELIKSQEVLLTDLVMSNSYGAYKVEGKVKNLSPSYTLSSFTLKITAYDCPGTEVSANCDVIGDETVSPYVGVPPGQLRAFDNSVFFSHMPQARNFHWAYQLIEIRAQTN